jgi:hypothetical protein
MKMTNMLLGFGLVSLAFAGHCVCLTQPVGAAANQPPQRQSGSPSVHPAGEAPLACNVGVYTPAQAARKEVVTKKLWASLQEYRELPDGYEFRFPADVDCVQTIAEWMVLERLCCPFFSFDLELEGEEGAPWLRVTGRPGVKEFISANFPRPDMRK